MPDLEPITREEMLLDGQDLEPITRKEMFIKRIYDKTQVIPEPITREEMFLKKAGDETTDVTIEQLNVSENGTYSEEGVAYSPVIVNVPAPPIPDNAYLLNEVEGLPKDIATFTDGSNLPMPSLKVGIEPIQEGSGDPSPTNIRPISGHTEVNVSVSGKNLLQNNSWYNFAYNASVGDTLDTSTSVSSWTTSDNETYTTTLTDWQRSGWLSTKLPQGTTVTSSVLFVSGNPRVTSYILDENFKITRSFGLANPISNNTQYGYTITLTNNECYFAIAIIGSNKTTVINKPIIEVGSTATAYEPYNGHTYTIQFRDGDNPLTVYGGSLDVVSGELVVDRYKGILAPAASSITVPSAKQCIFPTPAVANGYTLAATKLMCDKLTPSNYSTAEDNHIMNSNASLFSIVLSNEVGTTKEAWTQWFTDMQISVCYKIATPLTIQLTPTQVKSLLGSNNVWADTGKIEELEYFSKEV